MKPISFTPICGFIILFVLFSGSAFGISLEAQKEIEKLRAKLAGTVSQKKEIKKVNTEYVPGKKLAKALLRLKKMLRRDNNDQLSLRKIVKASSIKTDREYIPGRALKERLAQLKSVKSDKILVASIRPNLAAKKEAEEIKVIANDIKPKATKVLSPKAKKIEKPHKLVKATKTRKRKPNSSKQTHDDVRNKEFNADIRKFEFKMPDNYRIIVR